MLNEANAELAHYTSSDCSVGLAKVANGAHAKEGGERIFWIHTSSTKTPYVVEAPTMYSLVGATGVAPLDAPRYRRQPSSQRSPGPGPRGTGVRGLALAGS